MPGPPSSPPDVVTILMAAREHRPVVGLDEVLDSFRRRWLAWARRRYPSLESELDDAVQEAQLLVLARIDQLRDASKVWAWANSVFCSELNERARSRHRRARWHADGGGAEADALLARLADQRPTPEEEASARQRLQLVLEVVRASSLAQARWLEGLSESEIQQRTGFSRDAIASHLSRIRRVLRRFLDECDEHGRPPPATELLRHAGLPPEVRETLVRLLTTLCHKPTPGTVDSEGD